MIRFNCDYNEGAHPRVLEALVKTNMEQTPGYCEDPYCEKAAKVIKDLCKKEDAAVHFLVGGTQANLTVISSILRPYRQCFVWKKVISMCMRQELLRHVGTR